MKKVIALVVFALSSVLPVSALAASSDWKDLGGGKARLVANKDPETGRLEGVIEVRLNKGWKTYWKSPGGSGIAPEFDFSRSRDAYVESIAFPVPEFISLPDATFYGYTKTVGFVFSGMIETPQGGLDLDMLIGVCEEICIPATAQFDISSDQLNRSDPKSAVVLALAKSRLPAAAKETLQLTELTVSGDTLLLNGDAENGDGILKAVVSIATGQQNNWVSDPVALVSKDGNIRAEINVPESIVAQINEGTRWHYTLLRHNEQSGKVSEAVDGQFLAIKSQQ